MTSVAVSPQRRALATIWTLLACLAIAVGGYRIVRRGTAREATAVAADFRTVNLSTRAWARGDNPYGQADLRAAWARMHGPHDEDLPPQFWHDTPPLYPPGAFVAVWPLTLMPWPMLRIDWFCSNIVLSVLGWALLVRMMKLGWGAWQGAALGAIWVSLGPFVTCLKLGNPALATLMIGTLSLYLERKQWAVCAGLLAGLATCLKPQLGGVFVLYYALRPNYKSAGIGAAVFGVATIGAMARSAMAHVPLLQTLLQNLKDASTGGGV